MLKRRIVATFAVLLTLAACGALVWFNFFRNQMIAEFFATMKPPAQVVSATEVKARTWTPGITAIGTARAASGTQLAVEAAGIVKSINFKANDRVNRDDLLVQLEDAVERADLIEVETSIRVSEAALSRSEQLRSRGFDTQASLDQTRAQVDAARSRLARTQALIELKALQAPFSGTIGIPRVEVGQFVAVGTEVATLQDLDHMTVDFSVPEQQLTSLALGMPVRFGLSEDNLGYTGKITGIEPRGDPHTRLVGVRGDLNGNAGGDVIPGQFLHVRVDLPVEDNIVTIPQTALITALYGDYVYQVVPDETAGGDARIIRQVFVTPGRRDGTEIEIVRGINPGDVVVTAGQNKLQPGAAVTVDNTYDITRGSAPVVGTSQ